MLFNRRKLTPPGECTPCEYIFDRYICDGYIDLIANKNTNTPLSPAVFHILLALSNGALHGYAIMKQVEIDSHGRVRMGAGTLYGSLKRMLVAGLVRESDKRIDPAMDDERRIYYQITQDGKRALTAELERYSQLVALARVRKLRMKVN